jgi:mannitol operon transcriptional antiterminator
LLNEAARAAEEGGVSLDSSTAGIRLSGSEGAIAALKNGLAEAGGELPRNNRERRTWLLLKALDNINQITKLYRYAVELGTSEATVSSDFDAMEQFLASYEIRLERKPGVGVSVCGSERAARMAITTRLATDAEKPAEIESLYSQVQQTLALFTEELDWITDESLALFTLYVTVAVYRNLNGFQIIEEDNDDETETEKANDTIAIDAANSAAGQKIAKEIEARLGTDWTEGEIEDIVEQMETCRSKGHTRILPAYVTDLEKLENLTLEMIDAFDNTLSAALQTDERLVEGLREHMLPALIRMVRKVELKDPFHGELATSYPDLYKKTMRAIAVLSEKTGFTPLPAEISFIATHFYAALFKMDARKAKRRTPKAALVCVAGIGVSYMAVSQINRRFKGDLDVEISDWNNSAAWEDKDFIISTVTITDTNKPVVQISPLLTEDDYQAIRNAIGQYDIEDADAILPDEARTPLQGRVVEVVQHLQAVAALMDTFMVIPVASNVTFEELSRFAGEHFASRPEDAAVIAEDITKREQLYPQTLPQIGIILLHAKTKGTALPLFAVIVPEGGVFTDPYFYGAKSAPVMLVPETCNRELTTLMGYISSALVELPEFLEAVQQGNAPLIRGILDSEFSEPLALYCREKLR